MCVHKSCTPSMPMPVCPRTKRARTIGQSDNSIIMSALVYFAHLLRVQCACTHTQCVCARLLFLSCRLHPLQPASPHPPTALFVHMSVLRVLPIRFCTLCARALLSAHTHTHITSNCIQTQQRIYPNPGAMCVCVCVVRFYALVNSSFRA